MQKIYDKYKSMNQKQLKKDLKNLLKSMDFVSNNFLHGKSINKKKLGKEKYGGFPWEMKRDHLKNFPVIFDFDEKYQFLGLTILR